MLSLRSKITKKLLILFFLNPLEERYLSELARILNVQAQNLHTKLKKLESIGLFKSRKRGMERFYSINVKWPLYWEYKKIIQKTIGVPHIIAEHLQPVRHLNDVYVDYEDIQKKIQVVVVTRKETHLKTNAGTYAYTKPSEKAVTRAMKPLEKDLGRKIWVSFAEKAPAKGTLTKII